MRSKIEQQTDTGIRINEQNAGREKNAGMLDPGDEVDVDWGGKIIRSTVFECYDTAYGIMVKLVCSEKPFRVVRARCKLVKGKK